MFRTALRLQTRGLLVSTAITATIVRSDKASSFCSAPENKIPTIYQYKICPFCNRVKAYLDYLKIEYKVVEVSPLTIKDRKKVPFAIFDGNTIDDSSSIIQHITNSMLDKSKVKLSASVFLPSDTEKWNLWSEKKLAVMLYPNITRSFGESWECFEYSTDVQSWNIVERYLVRVLGPLAMYFRNSSVKKKHNIVNEREELHALLTEWTTALGDRTFLHGDMPTLPDILVYGVLHSIEGTRTWKEVMDHNGTLAAWYGRVNAAITATAGVQANK